MKKYKLLIVEDHPFTKQTLSYEFKKQEKIELIGALDNGEEAVDFVKKNEPDVILMDINMPVMDGITATTEIKKFNSSIKIIMLTAFSEKEKVMGAFRSGANGYCVKEAKIEELMKIIEIVSEGGIWFDTQIAGFIFDVLKKMEAEEENEKKTKTAEDYDITKRERNVLKLVADGYSNMQIADELFISKNTVKNHIASIINKLALKDRTQIAVFAIKNNLLG